MDTDDAMDLALQATDAKRAIAYCREQGLLDVDALNKKIRDGRRGARPSWTDYFMGLAFVVSRRSHDVQTKHGCIIVDRRHNVIGCGYNGHIRDGKETLPVTRPEKYPYMLHSEENALINCVIQPKYVVGGVTAFITGRPCLHCSELLWQAEVQHWILAERKGWAQPRPDEEEAFREMGLDTKVDIAWVKPDLNWMFDDDLTRELRELGFVD